MSEISFDPPDPHDFLDFDSLLSEEEVLLRDTVRSYVDKEIKPRVGDWWDDGTIPHEELAKTFGELGMLGMHLEGYGCAGTSATAYGLACLELEAGDSGIRSFVSVQGSLAMFPHMEVRLRGTKTGVAAEDGHRRRDRLFRTDRSRLRV